MSRHTRTGIREALEAAGATLMNLTPYSPVLNPIELALSKFKRLLRTAARQMVKTLWHTCGEVLSPFAPDDFINDIRHCGYRYAEEQNAPAERT